MKPFTIPAFDEGTISGYNKLAAFIVRSFNSKRNSAVAKAAWLTDVAAAITEVAKEWRKKAYDDVFAEGDLAPYVRLDKNNQPDNKYFGKHFEYRGYKCYVDCKPTTLVKKTMLQVQDAFYRSSPEGLAFLATNEGKEIEAAVLEYQRLMDSAASKYVVVESLIGHYRTTHNLPMKIYDGEITFHIKDKAAEKEESKKPSKKLQTKDK